MLFLFSTHVARLFFLKSIILSVSEGQHQEDGQQQGFEWILWRQEWWKWMLSAG